MVNIPESGVPGDANITPPEGELSGAGALALAAGVQRHVTHIQEMENLASLITIEGDRDWIKTLKVDLKFKDLLEKAQAEGIKLVDNNSRTNGFYVVNREGENLGEVIVYLRKNWQNDLVAILEETLKLKPEVANASIGIVDDSVTDTQNQKPTDAEEDSETIVINTLERLNEKLKDVLEKYSELFGEEYGGINEIIDFIDIMGLSDYLDGANTDNIESLAVFSLRCRYNMESQISFFNGLLNRLASMPIEVQAYILKFNELLRSYTVARQSSLPVGSAEYNNYLEKQQKKYEQILDSLFNLFEGEDLEGNLKALKYLFETYIRNGNTEASLNQFFVDLGKHPRFSGDGLLIDE